MKTQTLATLVGLGTLTFGSTAAADLITFVAEGNITTLFDPFDLTGGATTWSWTYSFDSDAPDQFPGNPEIGQYALGDWELTLGLLTVSSNGDEIVVFDDHMGSFDAYQVTGETSPPAGWALFGPTFSLITFDLSIIGSDALPLTPPNPADFGTRAFALYGLTDDNDVLSVHGDVKSIEIVPAPGALALLGLAGLTGIRRRRR